MSESARAIGIDIGGTKTAVAAVDATGRIQVRATFKTESKRGFTTCFTELTENIHRVLSAAKWSAGSLCGIGIGCAGPVDSVRGTINNPYTLPGWEGAQITQPLREAFSVPTWLENDADAAAVGEFRFGAGAGANPLLMVTLGTGIGGAVLTNGKIYRGVNGEHPELGHIPILPNGPECYCGEAGCWESIAGGISITAAGVPLGFSEPRAVFAATSSNPAAGAIINNVVNATAKAAWTLAHTFLPQKIILGGGMGEEHFERFASAMRNQISRATQIPFTRIEVVKAHLGNEAGVVGAACLAFRNSNTLVNIHEE